MEARDIPVVAAWVAATPLWQRYRLQEKAAGAQLESALARADVLLTVDTDAQRQRACALAWVMPIGAFGRSPYLQILGVSVAYRGQGIGAALLNAAEAEAARRAGELFLLVSDFNTSAQRFYRRQGYLQIGAIPGYVLPDVAELLFWKRLTSAGHDPTRLFGVLEP